MSTKNKKSVVSQALLEMDEITSAIKEESKKSIKNLLSEAVREALREGCEEEEEKDYEIEDEEQNDAQDDIENSDMSDDSNVEGDENMESSDEMNGDESVDAGLDAEPQEAPAEGEGEGENDWSDFEKYQVGDDTYDLTGENDYENVVKVYKLLKDEDQVVVKQDGNKIQLKDDSVGTEYVIDLGGDDNGETAEVDNGEENFDSLQEGILGPDDPDFWPKYLPRNRETSNIAGFEDEEDIEDIEEPISMEREPSNTELARASRGIEFNPSDLDINSLLDDEDDFLYESKINNKNKKTRKPMKESKEVLFEVDLGYTDNYQDKDPIAGLSNNEPSKSGKSWHKGVPTNTAKPWAGETKSKGEPFEKTVNEEEMPMGGEVPVDEQKNVGGFAQQNSVTRSELTNSNGRKARSAHQGAKQVTGSADNRSTMAEMKKLMAEMKKLKAENKVLKEALLSLKGNLSEAYVTNVNLGKITKLFLENTTTQAEKVDIVERFSKEAKTVEQSNTLYESIKRELNKNATSKVNINESMNVANNTINESVYKSSEVIKSIDLMNRMKNY